MGVGGRSCGVVSGACICNLSRSVMTSNCPVTSGVGPYGLRAHKTAGNSVGHTVHLNGTPTNDNRSYCLGNVVIRFSLALAGRT